MGYFPIVVALTVLILVFVALIITGISDIGIVVRIDTVKLNKISVEKHLHESLISCIEFLNVDFCLNGGSCFNYTMGGSSIPLCECAVGFMGERCERKYLSRSYYQHEYKEAEDDFPVQNTPGAGISKIQRQNGSFVTESDTTSKIPTSATGRICPTKKALYLADGGNNKCLMKILSFSRVFFIMLTWLQ